MNHFLTHYATECTTLLRNPGGLLQIAASAILLLALLHFGFPSGTNISTLLPPLLLSTLIITLMPISAHAFDGDIAHDRITHWRSAALALEWIITAKLLAIISLIALPLSLLFSAIIALHQPITFAAFGFTYGLFLLCSISIIACGLLTAALATRFHNQPMLHGILMLPAMSSIIIFGAQSLTGGTAATVIVALTLLYSALCCIGSAWLLRG